MIKFAIVGAGAIAEQGYAPSVDVLPDADLEWVVDVDEDRAREMAEAFDASGYASEYGTVLDDVDAVIVATPPRFHEEITERCLREDVHVLTEKPIAVSAEAATDLVSLADDRDLHYGISRQLREAPSSRILRSFVTNGSIGEPESFEVTFGGETHWEFASEYRLDESEALGGVLTDRGPHVLDLLLWIFEDRPTVEAYRDDDLGGLEANAELELVFESTGVTGTVELTGSRDIENEITIRGDEGELSARPGAETATLLDFETGERAELTTADEVPTRFSQRIGRQVQRFADAIRTDSVTYVPAENGMEILRIEEECRETGEIDLQPWEEKYLDVPTGGS